MSDRAAWLGADQIPKHRLARTALMNPPRIDYAIDGMFPQNSLVLLWGPFESFKSTIMADIGVATADTRDFYGHKVKRGLAYLLVGEDSFGMDRRIAARCIASGVDLSTAPFLVTDVGCSLLKTDNVKRLGDRFETLMTKWKLNSLYFGVDTLVKNFGEGDENSTADISHLLENLDRHIKERFKALVVVAHHPGHAKSGRPRGSSALLPGVDMSVVMKKTDGGVLMECLRAKQGTRFPPLLFIGSPVQLPWNTNAGTGKPDIGMALELVGEGSNIATLQDAPKAARLFALLRRKCASECDKYPTKYTSLTDPQVSIAGWHKAAKSKGVVKDRQGFYKLKKHLKEKGLIMIVDDKNVKLTREAME